MNPYPPWICVASRALSIAASLAINFAIAACFERFAGQHQRGRVVVRGASTMRAGFHSGDLELDGLPSSNRLAERRPLLGVLHAFIDATLRRASRQSRQRDTTFVEDPQKVRVTAPTLSQEVLGRNPNILERQRVVSDAFQPTLLYAGSAVNPGVGTGTRMDEISRLSPGPPGHRGDRDQAGDVGSRVGDELFGSVDDPVIAIEFRGGLGGTRIGSTARLGQAEGGESLATGQQRQPFLPLGFGPEPVDGHRTERHSASRVTATLWSTLPSSSRARQSAK